MIDNPRILIFSPPEAAELFDPAIFNSNNYDVANLSQEQAIESWLNTFLVDVLLIIVQPSAKEGLSYCTELLKAHPYLPILLVTCESTPSLLKQALEIGFVDFLTVVTKFGNNYSTFIVFQLYCFVGQNTRLKIINWVYSSNH